MSCLYLKVCLYKNISIKIFLFHSRFNLYSIINLSFRQMGSNSNTMEFFKVMIGFSTNNIDSFGRNCSFCQSFHQSGYLFKMLNSLILVLFLYILNYEFLVKSIGRINFMSFVHLLGFLLDFI